MERSPLDPATDSTEPIDPGHQEPGAEERYLEAAGNGTSSAGEFATGLRADHPWESQIGGAHVLYGTGRLDELGSVVARLGGERVLLVADPGITGAGYSARALSVMERSGLRPQLFDAVSENPSEADVEAGAEAARAHQADFLVGLGGGSAMDCCKGINFVYSNGGQMSDYEGFCRIDLPLLASVGVPTTAGTGSEAQSYALISDSAHRKMACGDPGARFKAVLLDPALTDSLPRRIAAASALDAVTHAVESFVTRSRTEASSEFAKAAWRGLEGNLEHALGHSGDHQAWGMMQISAFLAGVAIEQSMLGAAHACANPLTARFGTTHGVAVALMMPHVVRFNAAQVAEEYAELWGARSGADSDDFNGQAGNAAEALARRIEQLRSFADLPSSLGDLGIDGNEVSTDLAAEASRQWTLSFNPRETSLTDLRELYEVAA